MKLINMHVGPLTETSLDYKLCQAEMLRQNTLNPLSAEYWPAHTKFMKDCAKYCPELFRKIFEFNFSKTGDNF